MPNYMTHFGPTGEWCSANNVWCMVAVPKAYRILDIDTYQSLSLPHLMLLWGFLVKHPLMSDKQAL